MTPNTRNSICPHGPFETIWANQWEPDGSDAKQFAWRCYEARFGVGSCINEDINKVINQYEMGEREIPDFDMLVGGFPCQDYSVAKPLSRSGGIEGKKGVLWWDIYRMLHLKKPKYLLLENVDRLLKSPVKQRGRDFAIILSCLADEGYSVEWRVINAAEYGMPQKRRRTYIYGVLTDDKWDLEERVVSSGILAKAFPVLPALPAKLSWMSLPSHMRFLVTLVSAGRKARSKMLAACRAARCLAVRFTLVMMARR